MTNNTILGNSGSGICWENAFPTLANNIVAYNTWGLDQDVGNPYATTITHNDVYGNSVHGEKTNYFQLADLTGTLGNISLDPKLVVYGAGRMRLQPGSPCIGAGDDTAVLLGSTDFDLQPRIQEHPRRHRRGRVGRDRVDGCSRGGSREAGGSDANDGSSWAAAKATIQNALEAAWTRGGGEVWGRRRERTPSI